MSAEQEALGEVEPPGEPQGTERAQRPARDLARHTLIYGSGFVTMATASFVLTPVYTHFLSPSEFGLLALMLVLYGLLTQLYDLGFTNSVGRFYFDSRAESGERGLSRMRATSMGFMALYGGVLTLGLLLLAPVVSRILTGTTGHADLVRIVGVTLYAEALAIVPLTLIRMQERSRVFVAIALTRFGATLGLNILFVVVFGWGVRGILLGNALASVGVLLALLPDYALGLKARPSREVLVKMLAFGLPFVPVLLSGWLIVASDRFLLEVFTTRAEVGWYALAYKVGQVMQIAVAAFSLGWAPLRYRIYERPDAQRVYRQLTSYYVIAVSLLAVGLAVYAEQIVALIAPPSFEPAATVVPLIVVAYGLFGLYLMMVTGMGVSKRTAPMAWIGGAAAAINVGLNVLLIPVWGMKAAAATTVAANLILVGGSWFYSQKVYPIPYDWRRIARITAIGVVIVAVAALAVPSGSVAGIVFAGVAWLVFVLALLTTGAVGREELSALRAWALRARSRIQRRPAGEEAV